MRSAINRSAIDPVASFEGGSPAGADRTDEVVDEDLVEDELLVEEISIDGMCGVY
ncbi:MAG TPA: mycofactocin precursor MftA [Acidimicrobiales bacterium]|nr:mycofactocin precursor MftA [Acidimicrobiales bacterium]